MSYLDAILERKREEIASLKNSYDLAALRAGVKPTEKPVLEGFRALKTVQRKIVIAEFKRKSPSHGHINPKANLAAQIEAYRAAGVAGVSVLTDGPGFGGSYADLAQAARLLQHSGVAVLQKDFILDPLQILLARQHGADMILLIARVLSRGELLALAQEAHTLNMAVLVEVHDADDLSKIAGLPLPLVGVNNRDLQHFRLALNAANVWARRLPKGTITISESGVQSPLDAAITGLHTDGFLVGTGLMLPDEQGPSTLLSALQGNHRKYYLKACGLRSHLQVSEMGEVVDLIGLNFSPISKRCISAKAVQEIPSMPQLVAVFYGQSETEIDETLARRSFRRVQVYAGQVSVAFIRSRREQVLLAAKVSAEADLGALEAYAPYVDAFILDGPQPGSGTPLSGVDLSTFPYPFLLAGGISPTHLPRLLDYPNCIGVDVASGLEIEGVPSRANAEKIRARLDTLLQPSMFHY